MITPTFSLTRVVAHRHMSQRTQAILPIISRTRAFARAHELLHVHTPSHPQTHAALTSAIVISIMFLKCVVGCIYRKN